MRNFRRLLTAGLKEAPVGGPGMVEGLFRWVRELGHFRGDAEPATRLDELPPHADPSLLDELSRDRAEVALAAHTAEAATTFGTLEAGHEVRLRELEKAAVSHDAEFQRLIAWEQEELDCMRRAGFPAELRERDLVGLRAVYATMVARRDGLIRKRRATMTDVVRAGLAGPNDTKALLYWNLVERECSMREAAAASGDLRSRSAWVDADHPGTKAATDRIHAQRRRWKRRLEERNRVL